MYDKLTELISNGEYNEALYEFQEEFFHIDERTPLDAAKLCVLEATLWETLFDSNAEFDAIARGISYDPRSYELFYMLGLYYRNININKAYLCMEMALFYCEDEADLETIKAEMEAVASETSMRVRKVSIVILSYNDLDIMMDCIASIEETMPPGSYEVIVVDNASTERGVSEFLRGKRDTAPYPFKLIENETNLGFSAGCNIGTLACSEGNDIFFLNNDAVLMPNSLFFLRMGLYENRNVGAVSALSNSASLQEIDSQTILGYLGRKDLLLSDAESCEIPWHKRVGYKEAVGIFREYAQHKTVPSRNPYMRCFRLTGFALLVSEDALRTVAPDKKVFDEFFSPAYFEDDDLGIRIARAGYEQYLCTNSLIFHNGGSGFGSGNDLMEISHRKFIEKWGFDIWGYSLPRKGSADRAIELARQNNEKLRIIDFTCGLGATAAYIKNRLPEAFVAGVCSTSFEAGIAANIADDVVFGDMNTMRLPWKSHSFDVVLTEKGLISRGRIQECLRNDGICIDQEDF